MKSFGFNVSVQTSASMSTFVNSWKLNKNCRDTINPPNKEVGPQDCSVFQAKHSELRYLPLIQIKWRIYIMMIFNVLHSSCFGAVSPAPYHELCRRMPSGDFSKKLKSLEHSYIQACERVGVSREYI